MQNTTNPKSKKFYSENELRQLAGFALKKAKQLGASSAETNISTTIGFEVSVRKQKIEKIEHHQSKGLGVKVYFDHQSGAAATTDLKPDAINLSIEKACYIARYTNQDLCAGLADAELMAHNYKDLNLYHPWKINIEEAIDLALACENYGFSEDKRIINAEGTSISSLNSFKIYANTHGFIGSYPTSMHSISCVLIAEQNGEMQVDYEYTTERNAKDLESIKTIGKKAALKTVKRLGAKHLTTRECPVIFLAPVAKSLIGHFLTAISGGNLYNKASFLLDQLHKQVFSNHISIDERPHLSKGYGSVPFDNEGVITRPRFIVKNGILEGYILNSYSARKLNMQTTGNAGGIHNLFITTSNHDLQSLLKLMDKGLLVTELLGQGVNIVSGDYSRGAFGFWVENGNIQYPVENITVACNLKDLFLNFVAIGNDIDNRGNIHTGSILSDKMKVAGYN